MHEDLQGFTRIDFHWIHKCVSFLSNLYQHAIYQLKYQLPQIFW